MSHHPHASIDRESSPGLDLDDVWPCEPTEVFVVQRPYYEHGTEPEPLPVSGAGDDDDFAEEPTTPLGPDMPESAYSA